GHRAGRQKPSQTGSEGTRPVQGSGAGCGGCAAPAGSGSGSVRSGRSAGEDWAGDSTARRRIPRPLRTPCRSGPAKCGLTVAAVAVFGRPLLTLVIVGAIPAAVTRAGAGVGPALPGKRFFEYLPTAEALFSQLRVVGFDLPADAVHGRLHDLPASFAGHGRSLPLGDLAGDGEFSRGQDMIDDPCGGEALLRRG